MKGIVLAGGLRHIAYTYQEGEGGIADALNLCEHFADGQDICVVLGDNIIEKNIRGAVDAFWSQEKGRAHSPERVPDAERFGVAEFAVDRIVGIEEKPEHPKSNYVVTGIYMYDTAVFDSRRAAGNRKCQRPSASHRGTSRSSCPRGHMRY